MIRFLRIVACISAIAAVVAACSNGTPLRDIAAARAVPMTQSGPVIVFLPGTLASTLTDADTGKRVWGLDDALSVDPRTTDGLRLLSLPLTSVPSTVGAAPDSVRADNILRRVNERVLGIPVSLAVYEDLLIGLAEAGLAETAPLAIPTNGPSLTAFPYDWRRSIVDAAQELGSALEARGPDAQKVRLVGHSMGGVVALWYLMHGTAALDSEGASPPVTWAGAEHVEHAILVGAPMRGAAVAVRNTINGNTLAGPLVPTFPPAMLASHPSSFELMPREAARTLVNEDGTPLSVDLLDPEIWRRSGWGLADPTQQDAIAKLVGKKGDAWQIALARQAALIARGQAFHAAADRMVDPPAGLRITAIVGTGTSTPLTVAMRPDGGRVSVYGTADGDGTVLRSSATAGFEDADAHPRKDLHFYEVEHMRMLSQPALFEKVLEVLLAP